jgi:hypothetical protein
VSTTDEDAESAVETLPAFDAQASVPGEGAPVEEQTPEILERPRDELLVGIASALLAISVFFPWYESAGGAIKVSGWASGTWGPISFFFALAAVAIVGLRRARVPLSFPLEHTLILEAVGWISVIGILIKRLRPLKLSDQLGGGTLGSARGIFIALGAAILVALLAGRLSTGTSFVIRPGWLRESGGKLVAAILVVALIAGIAFGLTNKAGDAKGAAPPKGSSITPVQGLPQCAKRLGFPVPSRVKPTTGIEPIGGVGYCVAQFTTTLSVTKAFRRYQTALAKAGWSFKTSAQPQTSSARALELTRPQCGTLSFVGRKGARQRELSAFFQDCSKVSRPPSRSP